MEMLRGRLLGKIDDILAQIVSNGTPSNSQLQIEASLVVPQNTGRLGRRVILDSIDIDDLRNQVANSRASSTASTPRSSSAEVGRTTSPPTTLGLRSMPCASDDIATLDPIFQYPAAALDTNFLGDPFTRTILQPDTTRRSAPVAVDTTQPSYNVNNLPRRPNAADTSIPKPEQASINKLIEGIFEQIHNPKSLLIGDDLQEAIQWLFDSMAGQTTRPTSTNLDFSNATKCCRQITTSSRTARAFEVMVQAYWIDCYDARLAALKADRPELRAQELRKTVMTEACTAFSWSEKELRNRMAIWKGYREIKTAAGWSALIFAGPGIYRFCKYRLGFDQDSMDKLRRLRLRAEVAADTLQPQWRNLLSLVGEPTQVRWQGHPHDWTVSMNEGEDPVPLALTYRQWDASFTFTHLYESIIDIDEWGDQDPRQFELGTEHYCRSCSQRQSLHPDENQCECFPDLYSPNPRAPTPVQIFRTENGKNNGLIACCAFSQGQAVGEFIGMITKDLADVDVMQSQAGQHEPYQIWQGRCGNFTRFMNHSCASNCQFQTFSWLGIQRIVVVSKGVVAGTELTVDYSGRYWDNLDKICLCGEASCRYKNR